MFKTLKRYFNRRYTHINKTPNQSCSILNEASQPNGKDMLTHDSYLSYNIKNIMSQFVLENIQKIKQQEIPSNPLHIHLTSKLSTQQDIESNWCRYWLNQLKVELNYQRKNWELAFVLQVLFDNDMFGKAGIGLACGSEIVPSYLIAQGCMVTAGDKPFEQNDIDQCGWASTSQYTQSKESLFHEHLVSREEFDKKFTLAYVDMNDLPEDLYGQFDFCWSICAMEHLGSIKNGLNFLKNSLKLLKPGGISVHTTEFNIFTEKTTIDNWGSVLFQKKHFLELSKEVAKEGGQLFPFNYDIGNGLFDRYIDMPPYPHQPVIGIDETLPPINTCPHIKLLIDGFPATCAGVILQKTL